MCRGVEAIKPKGNGVEDEEERSRETDSSCFYIRSGGCLLVCKRREGLSGVGGGLYIAKKQKMPPPYELVLSKVSSCKTTFLLYFYIFIF